MWSILEAEMGERVAHLVTGKMMDFIQFDDNFAIVKTRAPGFMAEDAGRNRCAQDASHHHRGREATARTLPAGGAGNGDLHVGPADRFRPDRRRRFAALC